MGLEWVKKAVHVSGGFILLSLLSLQKWTTIIFYPTVLLTNYVEKVKFYMNNFCMQQRIRDPRIEPPP
jgi:hypothetical protein